MCVRLIFVDDWRRISRQSEQAEYYGRAGLLYSGIDTDFLSVDFSFM